MQFLLCFTFWHMATTYRWCNSSKGNKTSNVQIKPQTVQNVKCEAMNRTKLNRIASTGIGSWQTMCVCMHHILNVYGNRSNNCRRNMAAGKHSDFFCMSRSINQSWTKSPNGLAVIANTILTFCVRNNQLCISNSFRAESIQSNLYASNRIELYRIVSHWNCINHFLFVAQHLCNVMFEFLLIFLLLS